MIDDNNQNYLDTYEQHDIYTCFAPCIQQCLSDLFDRQLEEHFCESGPVVICAPKDGGDVFDVAGFSATMGAFQFQRIERNVNGDGIDTLSGEVIGAVAEAFKEIGGIGFEIDITTQGRSRWRYVDAKRQIRGFWVDYDIDDLDAAELQSILEKVEAAVSR